MRRTGDLLLMDVGHAFIRYMVLHFEPDLEIRVAAAGEVPSDGFVNGTISHMKIASEKIREVIEAAKAAADVRRLDGIWVGHSGNHVRSDNITREQVLVHNRPVTNRIEERLKQQAEKHIPADYLLLHSFRQFSSLDGIRRDSAVGQLGTQLLSRFHLIYTRLPVINNIKTVFREAGYTIDRFIFNGLSAARSVIGNGEETHLGCLLIHIGASTCDYIVYQEGQPFLSGSLNEGWKRLARDVAVGVQIPLDKAEELIRTKGATYDMGAELDERLGVKTIFGEESELTRRHISKMMGCAADDIFVAIRDQLKNFICRGHIPGGVILTGGGALTKGVVYSVTEVFGVHARVGIPEFSLTGESFSPAWAPIIGMAAMALTEFTPPGRPEKVLEFVTAPAGALWRRMFPTAKDPKEPEGEPLS